MIGTRVGHVARGRRRSGLSDCNNLTDHALPARVVGDDVSMTASSVRRVTPCAICPLSPVAVAAQASLRSFTPCPFMASRPEQAGLVQGRRDKALP
jgi:hypothetical protein